MGKLRTKKFLRAAFGTVLDMENLAYTDLTPWLRDTGGSAFAVRRGRQQTTQRFNTGKGTFVLDNRDLLFESLNTRGGLYGLLTPMVPIEYGIEYPWLPGLMPNPAFRDRTLGISAWASFTACTGAYVAPLDQMQYGYLRLTASTTNTGFTAQSQAILVPLERRGTNIVGSSRWENRSLHTAPVFMSIRFYSDAAGTTFISAVSGSTVSVPTIQAIGGARCFVSTAVPSNAQSMRVQLSTSNTVGIAPGDPWQVTNVVLDYATTQGEDIQYQGFSEAWNCVATGNDNVCTLTCSDVSKSMGLTPMNSPLYGKYIASLNPGAWWRFGETYEPGQSAGQFAARSLKFKEEISNSTDGRVISDGDTFPYANLALTGRGPLPGIAGCSPLDTDFGFSLVGPSSEDYGALNLGERLMPDTANWSISFWVRSTDAKAPASPFGESLMHQTYPGINTQAILEDPQINVYMLDSGRMTAGFVGYRVLDSQYGGCHPFDMSGDLIATPQTTWVADQMWHNFVLTYGLAPNRLRVYCDGVLDHTVPNYYDDLTGDGASLAGWVSQGTGFNWIIGQTFTPTDGRFLLEIDEFFRVGSELSGAAVSALYVAAKVQYPAETSSARVDRAASLVGITASKKNINTTKGVVVTQVTAPFSKANAVQYSQQVEDTEQGMFYIDKKGRVTFVTRDMIAEAVAPFGAPTYTFGTLSDSATEIPFDDVSTSNDDSILYTAAEATRVGGTTRYSEIAAASARFLKRTITVTNLLTASDDRAQAVADFQASLYSTVGTRLNAIQYDPEMSEGALIAYRNIELGHIVRVNYRPTSGLYRKPKVLVYYDFGIGSVFLDLAAAGFDVTPTNALPTVASATLAGYDMIVMDAGYNGLTGVPDLTRAYELYNAGFNVLTTGNDTLQTAGNPIWTGVGSTGGAVATNVVAGTRFLNVNSLPFTDTDNGLYLTGVRSTATTFLTSLVTGTPRPVGIYEENPTGIGSRYIHLQNWTATMADSMVIALTRWLTSGGITYSLLAAVQSIDTTGARNDQRVTMSVSTIYAQRWMQFGDDFSSHNMSI